MSTLIARKLARRAHPGSAHGAQDYLDLRAGRYWTGRRAHTTLADAFAGAGFTFARSSQASYWSAAGVLSYGGGPAAHGPRPGHARGARSAARGCQDHPHHAARDDRQRLLDEEQRHACRCQPGRGSGRGDDRRSRPPALRHVVHLRRWAQRRRGGGRQPLCRVRLREGGGGVNWAIFSFYYSAAVNGNWFNLQAGTVGGAANGPVGSSRNVGNGVRRIATAKTIAGVTSTTLQVAPANGDGVSSFTGDATKYLDFWGVEVELAGDRSFPTSYAAGTARAADSLTRPIAIPAAFVRQIGFTAPPSSRHLRHLADGRWQRGQPHPPGSATPAAMSG